MTRCKMNRRYFKIVICTLCFFLAGVTGQAGAQTSYPTIEKLTGGKVNTGDLIQKDNVDLVKEYLSVGVYELVKQGMVLKIKQSPKPWEAVPEFFRKATADSHAKHGKPVIDENVAIYTKDGQVWPGGLPFPEPESALEIMANAKYGHGLDDYKFYQFNIFVNKKGKHYKTMTMDGPFIFTTGRLKVPPLGHLPGKEKILEIGMPVITYPLDVKGLGQLSTRSWDEIKNPDQGFMYLPAFKRVVRISATTYQDNIGGSDFTYGDPNGLREPFSYWNFKLIGRKYILVPGLGLGTGKDNAPELKADGQIDPKLEFDVGKRFPRTEWILIPIDVVEGTPKIKHIYGKKVFYVSTPEYWPLWSQIRLVDIYDAQKTLWKVFHETNRYTKHFADGTPFPMARSISIQDVQSKHTTHFFAYFEINSGLKISEFSLQALIASGR